MNNPASTAQSSAPDGAGEEYDLIVLGTGSGGAASARKCKAAGWTVAVVDDQPYGGTCAVRGCDPKKVLVGAADVFSWQRRMQGFGLDGGATLNWRDLIEFKKTFTEPVPSRTERALDSSGIITIHGEARFISEDQLTVGGRQLRARKNVVIAAGAEPRKLGIPGEKFVTSSTEFLELESLPRRIAFIGAGFISLEFAHVAIRAGSEVAVLGRSRPLPHADRDVVDKLVEYSRQIGIDVMLGAEVTGVEQGDEGSFVVRFVADGEEMTLLADLVVHGAGRVPSTARLDADSGNVRLVPTGAVEVNEFLQSTSNPRVYAAGDVTQVQGSMPLTPVAGHEGAVVASNLLRGNSKTPDYRGVPSVVFTLPPLASVGLTEDEARARGLRIESQVRGYQLIGTPASVFANR